MGKSVAICQEIGCERANPSQIDVQPRAMQNYFVYRKDKEAVPTCSKDLYHKFYFQASDTVINCIEDRFDEEDFKMHPLLEQVLL